MNSLAQKLQNLGKPRILVVGDLILDRYVWGEVERISPEAPIPVLFAQRQEARLGGAGSVVSNLKALGAEALIFGIVGADEPARRFLSIMKGLGLLTRGIVKEPSRPTTQKTRFIARVQHILRVDEEVVSCLSEKIETKILSRLKKELSGSSALLLSDYNKGLLSPGVCRKIIATARKANLPVLVDPARIRDYSKYKGAYLVTPNREEAALASGLELADKAGKSIVANLEKAGAKFITELKLAACAVTLHDQGIFLKRKGKKGQIFPTRPRAAYDVTGAGDMVLAMLGATVAAGFSLEDAVALANIAGGLEVERIGVVPLTRQEILAELAGSPAHETRKVKSRTELKGLLTEHRRRGERIVFTNGCFDVLHAGHIKFLHFARSQGDVLVLGLNSDASVRKIKGPGRPIYTQNERAQMLSALADVDYVVIFGEPTPEKLIQAVKPDVLVKGEDWKEKGVVGRKFVETYGGKVILAPLVQGLSSSDIIRRARKKEKS